MKIIATLKSRNEERNIAAAIETYYDWVDEILLADGMSEDRTIGIAKEYFPKVRIKTFTGRYWRDDGSWRNREGAHLNFLFDWANERGADWIIHDDCDSRMNEAFKKQARQIIETTEEDTIRACRLYVYGESRHFKRMAFINDVWQKGLWAWRASIGLRAKDTNRHFDVEGGLEQYTYRDIEIPLCILHRFAPDDETLQRKLDDYKVEEPNVTHPENTYGKPVPLPEWALP